jgi:hypothetical protein
MTAAAAAASAAEQQMLINKVDTSVGSQLLQARDYMTLLAVCHAVYAQQVHDCTRGKASAFPKAAKDTAAATTAAAAGTSAAPAASQQLLRVLGVAQYIVAPRQYDNDDVVALMTRSCSALQYLVHFMLRNAGRLHSAGSSGSSSSAAPLNIAAVAAVLTPAVLEAWVQTLVELVLLFNPKYKGAPLVSVGLLLQAARSLVNAGAFGADGSLALDACKSRLFKPLLHQLLPDVWQALGSGKIWGMAQAKVRLGVSLMIDDEDRWQPALEQGLRAVLVETVAVGEHMTL